MCEVRRRGLAADSCLVARGMRDHSICKSGRDRDCLTRVRDGVIIGESRDVTVPRSGPDLNPHRPDLRRSAAQTLHKIWHIDVFADQRTAPMCPRGDLIPARGGTSPNRGSITSPK